MTTEINVLALVKGNERYVFLFDDDNRVEMLRQFGRFAANPDLSFTWYDAAVMSQKIRQTAPLERQEPARRGSTWRRGSVYRVDRRRCPAGRIRGLNRAVEHEAR